MTDDSKGLAMTRDTALHLQKAETKNDPRNRRPLLRSMTEPTRYNRNGVRS